MYIHAQHLLYSLVTTKNRAASNKIIILDRNKTNTHSCISTDVSIAL